MFDFCAERGLCVGNTYFKHKVAEGQGGIEVMSIIYFTLVKRDILKSLQDVSTIRIMG